MRSLDSIGRSGIGRAPLLRDVLARPGTRAWLRADGERLRNRPRRPPCTQLGPIVASDASVRARARERRARRRARAGLHRRAGPGARRSPTRSHSAASCASVRSCAWRWATRRACGERHASSRSPGRSSADMSTRPDRLAIDALRARLFEGLVIPAHPLALDASRRLDRRRQRALSRYYLDAGAGGLAVGVHTTQFAIREAGLFEEVLALAADTARTWQRLGDRPTRGRSSSLARAAARRRRSPRRASRASSATTRRCSASPRSRARAKTSSSPIAKRSPPRCR